MNNKLTLITDSTLGKRRDNIFDSIQISNRTRCKEYPQRLLSTQQERKSLLFFSLFFAPFEGPIIHYFRPAGCWFFDVFFFFKDRRFGKVDGICQLRRRRVIFFFDSRRSLYTPEERESLFCLSDGTSRPLFLPFCSLNLCIFDSSPPIAVRISLGLVEGTK